MGFTDLAAMTCSCCLLIRINLQAGEHGLLQFFPLEICSDLNGQKGIGKLSFDFNP